MKKASYVLLSWLMLIIVLCSCSSSNPVYQDLSDISDKQLGLLHETINKEELIEKYPYASVKSYANAMELFMDIEAERCEVAVLDEETALLVLSRNSDYACLDKKEITEEEIWYFIIPKSQIHHSIWENNEEYGWWHSWEDSLHRNILHNDAWTLIMGGLYTTLIIYVFSAILAIVIAILLTYMFINNRWKRIYGPLQWFIFTIHDVPSVVLMMFFYYVVFGFVDSVNGILVSVIALGIYSSGTLTRYFTIHINQISKEQREAAQMLGFSPLQIYYYIILPQAVKNMLPFFISEMKLLLRATSYAGYIAQKDLVKAVDAIRAQTYDAFVPLLFISLLYLALSWIIVRSISMLSSKLFHHD